MIPRFDNLASVEKPGPDELRGFIDGVKDFFGFILFKEPDLFAFLWEGDEELRALAASTFEGDVLPSLAELEEGIGTIDSEQVRKHGLAGRPLRFKLAIIGTINKGFGRAKSALKKRAMRSWFAAMVDAIDALLDSLVSAAGCGGLAKEFKDALKAVLPVRD